MNTPSYDEILTNLGLARLDNVGRGPDLGTAAVIFGVGVLTGAATALLLAPKSGRALRGDIRDGASSLGHTVVDRLPEVPNLNPFPSKGQSAEAIESKGER